MFVSNLNARLAQRFLALVLLPRVRRDIAEHKRLHFALFQALKKATYKPGAFYKVCVGSWIGVIFFEVFFVVEKVHRSTQESSCVGSWIAGI